MRIRTIGKQGLLLSLLVLTVFTGACRKEVVAPPPPAPAPAPTAAPAAPTVTLQANPTFIQAGESSTLRWSSTNATGLKLEPGIGAVAPEGSTRVTPRESTTYTLTASGPGGSREATARITVGAGAPPPPPRQPSATIEELFRANVFDAYYDYDKSDVRSDARGALSKTAEFLRAYPQIKVIVEGHCDERGSTEYNLGLGDRRAQAARQFLISLGVSADRMQTVSWGKERPFCTESAENCWQQNRRAHFVMAR